jgi:hypothetical protein
MKTLFSETAEVNGECVRFRDEIHKCVLKA